MCRHTRCRKPKRPSGKGVQARFQERNCLSGCLFLRARRLTNCKILLRTSESKDCSKKVRKYLRRFSENGEARSKKAAGTGSRCR